jgi:5-dehydro-2-deoxygluconokinase
MNRAQERTLDLVTLGRAAVDLYGEQIGGRLEDMASFAKYLGGCPANIAVGAARLGLRVGILTRVGDDHMGRFVRETLAAEGVDVSQVRTDRERLTALVVLGIRDRETFPLIFYRENCADMALEAADIDPLYVARASALVVTGTHFSAPKVDAASRTAIAAARAAGTKVVLDIDYRPVLWGLTGRGDGETRYVSSATVTANLQSIVHLCDLIVGTEEEIRIAGGSNDTLAALRRLRELSRAVIVLKRGNKGATIFDGPIPDAFMNAIDCPGFPVEVFNVLGAGDAFMAGLLAGWLRGKGWKEAGRIANACGALVVARHACAPAMPSQDELDVFLARAGAISVPREDAELTHLHRVTTGRRAIPEVLALAFDHRRQFEELAQRTGAAPERIAAFKRLIAEVVLTVRGEVPSLGAIVDDRYGAGALDSLSGSGMWLARPVELPGSRPLAFDGGIEPALMLRTWPVEQVAKCLVFYDAADPEPLRDAQEAALLELQRAARATGHEWLLELIPPAGRAHEATVPPALERLYAVGLAPDWWKLPPSHDARTWRKVGDVIRAYDPHARGVLLLGLDASDTELAAAFAAAAGEPMVRGFAVGRAIFWPTAERWFAGAITDQQAIRGMAEACRGVVAHWRRARGSDAVAARTASSASGGRAH